MSNTLFVVSRKLNQLLNSGFSYFMVFTVRKPSQKIEKVIHIRTVFDKIPSLALAR